jgi:glycine/D-amino acid oxidase-like deaminating enzyme
VQEAPFDEPSPPLEGTLDVDVSIVGGGYTGLWTALALRERDPALRVAILDAEVCGAGPSGRNGGFLHGYWSSLARVCERLGERAALELARAGDRIIPAVEAFCEHRGEDVWLRRGGLLKVSASPSQDVAVDRAVDAARRLGVSGEAVPLSRDELAERCRSPVFRRGVYFRDGATVQPARLVRALRRAALAEGVVVHERSPVVSVRDGLVETARGRVRTTSVVVAANAWETGWRPVCRHVTNFGSYIVLTEPVPELLDEIGWTGGEAVIDGRMFLHYFRTTADGRVVMGSGSGPIGYGGKVDGRFTADLATAGRAERGLRRLLPALERAAVTHAWGGPIDVSADQLPFFGTVAGTRIHYGVGYSGSGVGPSWLGGQILASLALGLDDSWTRLPLARRRVPSLPFEPVKRLGGGLVRAAVLAVEEAEEDGRRPPPVAVAIAALPRILGLPLGTR